MLVDRSVLIKYLEDKFIRVLLNDKPLEEAMYDYAEETYNFTKLQFSEYTSMRKALPEASDLELFVMTDSYLKQLELKNGNLRGVGKLSNYFTPKEIHDYSGLRFDADPLEKEIEWPLKFDMIQITDDQWIGKIDINELFYFIMLFILQSYLCQYILIFIFKCNFNFIFLTMQICCHHFAFHSFLIIDNINLIVFKICRYKFCCNP